MGILCFAYLTVLLLLITLASHLGKRGRHFRFPKKLSVFVPIILALEVNERLTLPGIGLHILY